MLDDGDEIEDKDKIDEDDDKAGDEDIEYAFDPILFF